MSSREDVAASCGVPVEWVPTNHASMAEDELVSAIEGAMMASQPSPEPKKPKKLKKTKPARDISTAREVDTYGDYILAICGNPMLRLHDGTQAVQLERRFVGATLSHDGSHLQNHGRRGMADLAGGLIVEFWKCPWGCPWEMPPQRHVELSEDDLVCMSKHGDAVAHRIEVRLEIEVKKTKGIVSDVQTARQEAFRKRGGVYLVARSLDDAVSQILLEIERIKSLI